MIDQETRQKSRSGGHRPVCIDYTAQERRQASEQYKPPPGPMQSARAAGSTKPTPPQQT